MSSLHDKDDDDDEKCNPIQPTIAMTCTQKIFSREKKRQNSTSTSTIYTF